MGASNQVLWNLFVVAALSITIVLVAFVAALAFAQRERTRMRQQQAVLVARAHEEERAWVASELHDDVLQRVALIRAEVESLWSHSEPRSTEVLEDRLRGINAELVDLAVAVRRIASRLHPTVVDQVGLLPALQSLAEEVGRGSDVEVSVESAGNAGTIAPETARAAYRIVQESLRNVVRHSGSRSAKVALNVDAKGLALRVRDDGRGFDATVVQRHGLGLASLRERALCVGGTAEIHSTPGAGTTIDVLLPAGTP